MLAKPEHKVRKKLMQLLRDNVAQIGNAVRCEAGPDEAHIYVYDMIDPYWGVSAEAFVKAMAGITAPTIHMHINSPGGDVFEARAMATAIAGSQSRVIAHIDGVAASAATYVALAAHEVRMSEGALFMIHNAWTFAYGNADELRQSADLLDKIDTTIVADYVRKTGKSDATVVDWMAAETWFTAAEALDAGFIDSVTAIEQPGAASAKASMWNLSAFERAPKRPDPPARPQIDDAEVQAQAQRNRNRLAMLAGRDLA